jgi:hypothetical protein
MMADKAPYLEPEEALNDWTFSTDAERDRYFNALAAEVGLADRTECTGLHPRMAVTFKHADKSESLPMKSHYQREIVKLGIRTAGGFNTCRSHSDGDIDRPPDASRASLAILAAAVAVGDVKARLDGSPIEPVFRRA